MGLIHHISVSLTVYIYICTIAVVIFTLPDPSFPGFQDLIRLRSTSSILHPGHETTFEPNDFVSLEEFKSSDKKEKRAMQLKNALTIPEMNIVSCFHCRLFVFNTFLSTSLSSVLDGSYHFFTFVRVHRLPQDSL